MTPPGEMELREAKRRASLENEGDGKRLTQNMARSKHEPLGKLHS